MSSIYFIGNDGQSIIALDCEETISVSKNNSITRSSIMSGTQSSDGYIEGLLSVQVTGLITYSKSVSQQQAGLPNPIEFQNLIKEIERSHTRFKLYAGKGAHQLLQDIENCIIESRTITTQEYLDTIQVTMTISEVFVSDAATTTFLAPVKSEDAKKSLSDTDNTKGSKEAKTKEQSETIARKFFGRSLTGDEQ